MINDTNTQVADPATSLPQSSIKETAREALTSPSSSGFNTAVVKLAAKLLYMRNEQFGLESNMLGYLQDPDVTKVERFLIHWLLPLCIRMGTGRYGMSPHFIFIFTVKFNSWYFFPSLIFNRCVASLDIMLTSCGIFVYSFKRALIYKKDKFLGQWKLFSNQTSTHSTHCIKPWELYIDVCVVPHSSYGCTFLYISRHADTFYRRRDFCK